MKRFSIIFALLCIFIFSNQLKAQSYKVLFDNSKSQTAGNADWKIDDNEPTVLPVTPTSESDWIGGISSWGYDLWVTGDYSITQLPAGASYSYGDSSNPLDLQYFDVFVIVEPNNLFTDTEKEALIAFVENGGGIFFVGDHDGSDRDNDGSDSVDVLNDLFNNNPRNITNIFGFLMNYNSVSGSYTDLRTSLTEPVDTALFNGPFGAVTGIAYHSGGSITVNSTYNPKVRGQIWTSSSHLDSEVVVATSEFGLGRVALVGDSSPADDGTGQPGDTLYDGWNEVGVSDREVFLNLTKWLAEAGGAGNGITIGAVTHNPDPVTSYTNVNVFSDITDDVSIAAATLYYKIFNSDTYTSVSMINSSGNTYTATIPGMENTIVQYYIEAKDNEANTSVSPLNTYQVGLIPICDLRANDINGSNKYNGMKVTVNGIVTAPTLNCFGSAGTTNIYIQDESGCGINVYNGNSDLPNVSPGDKLEVTGFLTQNKGTLEILTSSPNASITVLESLTVPDPVVLTCSQIGEANEGQLVRINSVTTTDSIPASGSSGPLTITDSTGSTIIYIDRDGQIDGTTTPSGTFDVIGIVGQYDSTSPYGDGYQVYPRFVSDFVSGSTGVTYTLTTDVVDGNGTVTPAGSNLYNENSTISITATPASGYEFDYWSGDLTGSQNPVSVTMTGNFAVHAHFKQSVTPPISGGLIISEYIEGSSTNKAIELTNLSGTEIDLSAEGYTLEIYANGASSATTTINLTGNVNSNSTFVVATSLLSTYADQISDSVTFNGDDAVVLRKGTEIVDSIGQTGFDPGSAWISGSISTKDMTLRRKSTVLSGDTIADDIFDPAIQWDAFPQDTFDDLGGGSTPITPDNLIISEYVEGSSTNKAIELTNLGDSDIDLSADGYVLEIYANGASSATTTINLTGNVNSNSTFVIATTLLSTYADQISDSVTFNGDDAVVLRKGTEIVDSIGQTGFDPGSAWVSGSISTKDMTLRRKVSVTSGDTIVDDTFDPSLEWDAFPQNTFDDLGVITVPTFNLTTSVNGGFGTVNPSGTTTYNSGDSVTITALPDANYMFDNWSGDVIGNTNPVTITISSDLNVIASFKLIQYDLTTSVADGNGSINPTGINTYDAGTTVNLIASPDTGFKFSHWSGDVSGTNPSVSIVMDSSKTVYAHFETVVIPPVDTNLVLNEFLSDPYGAGDANCDGVESGTDDEFIELVNNSDSPLDISGYQIFDNTNLRFTFPDNTIIPANECTVVFAGGTPTGEFGNATANSLVFVTADGGGSGVLGMGNTGDTIIVKDNLGNIVINYTFKGVESNISQTRNPDITGEFVSHPNGINYSPGFKNDGISPFVNYAICDFNKDGNTDLLIRNYFTGSFNICYMNGIVKVSESDADQIPYKYEIVGTGDFNGDGDIDIVLRNIWNNKGKVYFLKNGIFQSSGNLPFIGSRLKLSGVGDFNKDGKPDLVLRNRKKRKTVVWLMNGMEKNETVNLPKYSNRWQLECITDLNNDGKDDMILHNSLYLMSKVVYLDGINKISETVLPDINFGWNYVASGDFNKDGKTDLIIQDWFTGNAKVLYMNSENEIGQDDIQNISYGCEIKN